MLGSRGISGRASDERGQALAVVLALVTLLFLVGTTLAAQASTALRTTAANNGQGNDFYAADGATELAIWWQRNGRPGNPPAITLNGLTATGTVAVSSPPTSGPGWPMWGYEGQSRAVSGSPGPAAYGLHWAVPPTVTQGATVASPTVADDGYVYVGGTTGLFAYRPDGTLAWSFLSASQVPALGAFIGSPAITTRGGQRLLIAGTDGAAATASTLLGLLENPTHTGAAVAWSFTLGVGVNRGFVGGARLNAAGTRAYVGARNGNVYAFDTTGAGALLPLWTAAVGGAVLVSPVLDDTATRLYAATSNGILRAYVVATGIQAWTRTVAAGRALTAPVFARVGARAHTYVATAATRTIVAVADLGASSAQDWFVPFAANASSAPTLRLVGAQTFLYVGDDGGNLRKLEDLGLSAPVRWTTTPVASAIRSPLATDASGDVYFGNQAGALYRIRDGGAAANTIWTGNPGRGAVASEVVIGVFGELYVVTAGNRLVAVGAAAIPNGVTVTGSAGASAVTATYNDVGAAVPTLRTWTASR